MDDASKKFRAELAGLAMANMAGAVVKASVVTMATRGQGPRSEIDLKKAAGLFRTCAMLAVTAADELLVALEKPAP